MINLALYREYRPKNFDEVIGQDHIVTTLKNQILTQSLSHAYLFCGTRGTGKTSTAKIFAKAINCLNSVNGSPCLECEVCKQLNSNSNLDILEIDAASNNRVDEIRELRDKIKYPPVVGKYKVYIIDEVHMLTDSAYNALLKTLEEPPKHAIFILCTTEVHKLPKTILSRCMRFDFKLVSNQDLVNLLAKIFKEKQINFEQEALNLIASRGEGSVRDTLSVADLCVAYSNKNVTYENCLKALGASNLDSLIKLCDAIANNNGEDLLVELHDLALSGKNFTILNKEILSHLKTLLVVKTVNNSQKFLMMPDDYYSKIKNQADKFSQEDLLNIMSKLSNIETQLKFSIDAKTMLEITLLSLLKIENENSLQKKTIVEDKFEDKKKELITKDETNKILASKDISAKSLVAKILKYLRENNFHLLSSIYQSFTQAEIEDNMLKITFDGENNKEILENVDNKNLINDIIKESNVKICYIFNKKIEEQDTVSVLKQKFSEIEIKE